MPFLRLAYSLLPLVWAGILAHYEELLMTELGLILPRFAVSLGAVPDADWLALLPVVGPAPAAVVSAAQGVTLLLGGALSWALAGKIVSQAGNARLRPDKRPEELSAADREAVWRHRVMVLAVWATLWNVML